MLSAEQVSNYLDLLKIRQAGMQRNTVITGSLFFTGLMLTLADGLFGPGNRSMYLIAIVDVSLGLAYINSWVRLEITKEKIELLNTLNH